MKQRILSKNTKAPNEATQNGGPGPHGARLQHIPPRHMPVLSVSRPVQITNIIVPFKELHGLRVVGLTARIRNGPMFSGENYTA